MTIKIKRTVNTNITPEFAVVLGQVALAWVDYGLGDFLVTSLKDGTHRPGGAHKQDRPDDEPGEAADIRTWRWWNEDKGCHHPKLIRFAKKLQAAGVAVVIHPDWILGVPHMHFARKNRVFQRL
ncbi:hypothetical protein LCGC14_2864110 [marine sediment metagenome]|uniref:Uncharacterized protein n=1 Tax=marine sediment metagenome TaxID=412755 RepID=A0A0F9AVZ8_9ZZZZ